MRDNNLILIWYRHSLVWSVRHSFQMVDVSPWTSAGPLIWSPDSPRRSLPSVGFIRSSVPSELLPRKLLQSDDCWMSSDRRRICSAVNYSARSISTSLREVWGPLASPLSAAPDVSHHQSLASRRAHFLTDYGEPRDEVLPPRSRRLKPSAVQLVSQGARVAFYPNFDWSLGPVTICPLISHLFKHNHRTTEQLQPSPQCHSLAFSIKKLYDSERSFELIISHNFSTLITSSLFCASLCDFAFPAFNSSRLISVWSLFSKKQTMIFGLSGVHE